MLEGRWDRNQYCLMIPYRHWQPIIISKLVMMPAKYLLNDWIINDNLCWSSQLISLSTPIHLLLQSHCTTCGSPRKGSSFQDCRFCTCSFLSLEWALLPLLSTGPLRLNLDTQGCCVQICRLFTRQEEPAWGATRGTISAWALLASCASWYRPAFAWKKECLFQSFTETPVLPGGLCPYPRVV